MKRLAVILLLAFGCISLQSQSAFPAVNPHGLSQRVESRPQLELTTTVMNKFSCSSDLFTLRLRFTFKNTGSEPVILDKASFITRSLVSTSMKAAAAQKYITEIKSDAYGVLPLRPNDLSKFAILKPGEVYELESDQTRESFLMSDNEENRQDRLLPGSYFLQVEVGTWTYLENARNFQKRWRDQGYLWFEGITSEPMLFTIEKDRSLTKCR